MLLGIAASAAAQSAVTLSVVHPQYSSESVTAGGERSPVSLSSRTGFGLGFMHRWQRLSTAIDVMRLSAPASAGFDSVPLAAGDVRTTTFSAIAAIHGGTTGRIDPYVGAGLAWVTTGDLHSADLDRSGLGTVSVGNDLAYVLNAGLAVPIRNALAVGLDARYMPVNVDARAGGQSGRLQFNALTIAASLRWSF